MILIRIVSSVMLIISCIRVVVRGNVLMGIMEWGRNVWFVIHNVLLVEVEQRMDV